MSMVKFELLYKYRLLLFFTRLCSICIDEIGIRVGMDKKVTDQKTMEKCYFCYFYNFGSLILN